MRNIAWMIFLYLCFFPAGAHCQDFPNIEAFNKTDRVLIFAPHPDDEAIACAGVIQNALARGAQVRVAYLTNGEHNELAFIVYRKIPPILRWDFMAMGRLRRDEAIKAMGYLGLDRDKLIFLGYPDFGTFEIFRGYWNTNKPFWSLMTRISSVPYKDALSPAAPYVGESILNDFKEVLLKFRPNKIFVSHPYDVNVDHKTLYLFLEVALADLRNKLPRPRVYPYLVHDYGWPMPRDLHPSLKLDPPADLADSDIAWWKYRLSPQQLRKKHRSVLFYRSQTNSSAFYLLSFVRKNELFGDFVDIELARAPESLLSSALLKLSTKSSGMPQQKPPTYRAGPVTYTHENGKLVIRVQKAVKTAKHRMVSWVYLFGYNYKKPFNLMPKLHIYTKYNKLRVFNGLREIAVPADAAVSLTADELIITVPLEAMGNPDFVLASVRAYTGALPIYRSGFRRINLTRGAAYVRDEAGKNRKTR